MLPLTIFKAMSLCELYRSCPAGPSAFQRSIGCRTTLWTVSHPPGTVRAGLATVYQARADEAEARRGVLCCAETLAVDQCRKWLTKWRLKSADLSIMRDSHVGISGIKGLVPVLSGRLFNGIANFKTVTIFFFCEKDRQTESGAAIPLSIDNCCAPEFPSIIIKPTVREVLRTIHAVYQVDKQ